MPECPQCREYERFVRWLNTTMPGNGCIFESYKTAIAKHEQSMRNIAKLSRKMELRENRVERNRWSECV